MKKHLAQIVVVLLVLLAAMPALAQGPPPPPQDGEQLVLLTGILVGLIKTVTFLFGLFFTVYSCCNVFSWPDAWLWSTVVGVGAPLLILAFCGIQHEGFWRRERRVQDEASE